MNESKRLRPVRHLVGTAERSADNSLPVSILESVVPSHIPLKRHDTASTDSGLGLPLQILSSARVLCFVRMGLFPDFPWVASRYRFARVTTNTHSSVLARAAGATLIPHCLFADGVRRGSLIITCLIGVKIHLLPCSFYFQPQKHT